MNATYSCGQCGMSVKAQCAKCDVPLENGHLDLPDGCLRAGFPLPLLRRQDQVAPVLRLPT